MDINTLTALRIKEVRTQSGLTSQSVADDLGITIGSYSALENGKVAITIERLHQLSGIFNIPVSAMIPGSFNNQTINVSHGSHAINASTYNSFADKNAKEMLQKAMEILKIVMTKFKQ